MGVEGGFGAWAMSELGVGGKVGKVVTWEGGSGASRPAIQRPSIFISA